MKLTTRQLEAAKLWAAAEGREIGTAGQPGYVAAPTRSEQREAQFRISEEIAAGEFPSQLLPVMRRTLQKVQQTVQVVTPQFTTRKLVQAINVEEEIDIYSFDDQSNIPGENAGKTFTPGGLPALLPRERYPQIGLTASGKRIKAGKFGEAFGMEWEAIVRQRGMNVRLIRESIEAFGRHAKNQEEIDVARRLVSSTGFATTLTSVGIAMAGNPDLSSPETLPAAIAASKARKVGGVDTSYSSYVLLVAPAYEAQARRILAARRVTQVPARTGADSAVRSESWEEQIDLGGNVTVIGWKWLSTIYGSLGKGWILLPVASGDDLPILTSNYLEGYEQPSMWIKDSNARSFSGGEVNPEVDGDFDSDAVWTKVRHVHGSDLLWGDGIVFSTGANA